MMRFWVAIHFCIIHSAMMCDERILFYNPRHEIMSISAAIALNTTINAIGVKSAIHFTRLAEHDKINFARAH